VKALVFRHSLAREAASAIAGRVDRRAFVSRFAAARLEDVPELPLPAADWVRVRTTFSGLCGSDVKQILLNGSRDNPLTALVSFPHVLGHEVVGRRLDTGERVVLNPWLSCVPRGIDPVCPACLAGRYPWCRNFRSGDLPVSIHIGNCAAAAGARARLAVRLGSHAVLSSVPNGLVAEVARRVGGSPLVPWSGREWLQDGPGVVYDTIGSVETVETSLRLLMTGGTLVVSGVEPPKRFEWTPLYFKELRVVGSNGFGVEDVRGVAKHAMLHYFDFVSAGFDLTPVITHRFPLERWDEAVLALKDPGRTGAVKVLLEPGG
jgi:threonine dehydrogenase-like Zn-dependent dehydrogenase